LLLITCFSTHPAKTKQNSKPIISTYVFFLDSILYLPWLFALNNVLQETEFLNDYNITSSIAPGKELLHFIGKRFYWAFVFTESDYNSFDSYRFINLNWFGQVRLKVGGTGIIYAAVLIR